MNSKNIIYIISSFSGGPGDVLKDLLKYNSKYNIHCISLSCNYSDDILEVIKNRSSNYWILNKKSKFSSNIFFQIKGIINEVNPSAIYSFDFASNFYSRLFFKEDIQWFPMIHGLESAFVWWRVYLQRVAFKKADRLIVPSDALANKILKYKLINEDKIKRFYNGTKLESKTKDLTNFEKKEQFVVGMVANFYNEVKGHRYAIETIAKLQNNFTLEFVGDGILLENIKKQVKNLKVSDRVIFHGYLKKENIIKLMIDRFDVLIVPSLSESFGKVIIEAMSVGLPVIATNVGGIPEIIIDGETGLLVEPTKSEQMAAKTLQLLQSQELYTKMSLKAIERVKHNFDVEKMSQNYFGIIHEF